MISSGLVAISLPGVGNVALTPFVSMRLSARVLSGESPNTRTNSPPIRKSQPHAGAFGVYLIRQAFHRYSARRQINLANALGYNGFDLGIEKPKALGAAALSRSQRVNGANRFVSANQAIKRGLAYPEIPSDVPDVREPKRPLMTILATHGSPHVALSRRAMPPSPSALQARSVRRAPCLWVFPNISADNSQVRCRKVRDVIK